MDYKIISADPVAGRIQVEYSSTEEVVASYSFDVRRADGAVLTGAALDAEIRSRAPVWRLIQASEASTLTAFNSALTLGAYAAPLGSEPTLAQCKAAKLAQLNAFREQVLAAAGVRFAGHVFDSDSASVARLNLLANVLLGGGDLPAGFAWRSAANVNVPMTSKDVFGLLSAMLQHANEVFQTSWAKKSLVDKATTAEAVAAVTWTVAGLAGGVPQGNLFVTSGPSHHTTETEIAVDRVVVQ
jgi:hypothetical protein